MSRPGDQSDVRHGLFKKVLKVKLNSRPSGLNVILSVLVVTLKIAHN